MIMNPIPVVVVLVVMLVIAFSVGYIIYKATDDDYWY